MEFNRTHGEMFKDRALYFYGEKDYDAAVDALLKAKAFMPDDKEIDEVLKITDLDAALDKMREAEWKKDYNPDDERHAILAGLLNQGRAPEQQQQQQPQDTGSPPVPKPDSPRKLRPELQPQTPPSSIPRKDKRKGQEEGPAVWQPGAASAIDFCRFREWM